MTASRGGSSAGLASAPDRPAAPGPAESGSREQAGPAHTAGPRPPSKRWLGLVWLIALIVFLATGTGRMIFDTKLGVDIDAAGFYARLWPLWNSLEWLGSLQDQYIGYAIPMAPFFLAGQLLHLPVWLIERLWLSLLVAVAFWGMVRLATALRVGSPGTRLLAGAVFALWPTFTIMIGSTSAAILPGILAPWAVLPLVSAARGGSPGLAAARSGLAIMAMGGVNAVSTLCALVLPALYLLSHTSGRQRVRLGLYWVVAVAAATSWWVIPLLLDARYAFDFLPYIEQSVTTTGTMSAAAFLRGSGNWTAYFNLGTPWLPAGWTMVTAPGAILASALAAAVGLSGIARRDMPERRWLLTSLGLAALVALAGYWGPASGPLHSTVDQLFDGVLAPFRSVYKLEPVAGAVLALGCAHVLARGWRLALRIPGTLTRVAAGSVTAMLAALVLAGLALPYLDGQILQPGSFSRVPGYWYQAADFLAAHSATQTALVVPADAHGQYLWGDTIDDPLEPLARSPWAERALVPYGGAGAQDLLETAETAIDSGQQVPGLASYLDRAGIRYLVVRNDLSPSLLGYTPPQSVHATLALSQFRRVAAFGPLITAPPAGSSAPWPPPGQPLRYPAVEIFQAASPALRPSGPVSALPVSDTALVNGGPDALLQLAGQRLLGASQPAVIAGDPLDGRPALWAVTDAQRRADNAFGVVGASVSFTYTASQDNPPDEALGAAGGPPRQLLPVPAAGHQTVTVLSGAAQVTASSYGSWLTEDPQADPVYAFDGNPSTSWIEGSPSSPVGQWIQIRFDHPVRLAASIGVQLVADGPGRSVANQLQVATAAGRAVTTVLPENGTQRLRTAPGRTGWLRITIASASGVIPGELGAGIRDVLIPGVRVTPYLQPPEDPAGASAPAVGYSFQLSSPVGGHQPGAESALPLDRTFLTPKFQQLYLTATASARPGLALEALLARLDQSSRAALQVTSTSTFHANPNFGPANLFSHGRTPWIAGSPAAVLRLSWHGRRRISRLVLTPATGLPAPTTVEIASPAGLRLAPVGAGGVVSVSPPLTTTVLYLSFPGEQQAAAASPAVGQPTPAFGFARLSVPALSGLHAAVPQRSSRFTVPCGQGPAVTIDGQRYPTSVTGTFGQLLGFRPVQVRLCAPHGAVGLAAGKHWLQAGPSGVFTVTGLTLSGRANGTPDRLTAQPPGDPRAGASRRLRVVRWQPDSRAVRIGPGPAAYLEVHQDTNPGWVATIDGRRLTPARLDGWQQAFVVPAGQGGLITLSYAPATVYQAGLIASAAALAALLIVASGGMQRLQRLRRRRDGEPEFAGPAPPETALLTGSAQPEPARLTGPAQPDQAGPTGPAEPAGRGQIAIAPGSDSALPSAADSTSPRPARLARLARLFAGYRRGAAARAVGCVALVTALIFVAGGPVAIVVPVLAVLTARWPQSRAAITFLAMVWAGVLAASALAPTELGTGAFGAPAQVCALIALAAALCPAISIPPLRARRTRAGQPGGRPGGTREAGGGLPSGTNTTVLR